IRSSFARMATAGKNGPFGRSPAFNQARVGGLSQFEVLVLMSIADQIYLNSQTLGLGSERHRIESLLRDLGAADARINDPNELSKLWKSYLDFEQQRRTPADSLEKIAFLSWCEKQVAQENTNLVRAFRATGLSFSRTRLEIRLRLGSRLFSRGRKPGSGPDSRAIR